MGASPTGHNTLTVTGTATLDGAFVLLGLDGYAPVAPTSFAVLNYGSRVGAFASSSLPTQSSKSWEQHYDDPLYPSCPQPLAHGVALACPGPSPCGQTRKSRFARGLHPEPDTSPGSHRSVPSRQEEFKTSAEATNDFLPHLEPAPARFICASVTELMYSVARHRAGNPCDAVR